ncbi:MAG: DNA (cytosine-5-)-methyltransferase [Bacteroidales bacterium]|nr:DNA (cytosine-5-)-methyltransferase [Bacteroidales bacterium]
MKKYSTSLEAPILSNNTEIDWEGQSWKDRVFSHPERTVRIATAFSGIGSPEMALQQLGVKHEIVFACDIDKPATKSYMANYPISEDRWYNDIRTLDATKYRGQVDLFVGGVCCQPWSLSGKLEGWEDPRAKLFKDFVRVICQCQPKVWIFENVDNIVRATNTIDGEEVRSWPFLLNQMYDEFKKAGLNYDLHWRILNAAEYGVPQHRERVFCIGFLEETNFLFPAPIELEKNVYDYLDDKTPGIRELTARERVRLMGFPDTFKQVVSDSQLSKQSGNSIVVDCMMALYKQMDITKYGIAA